MRPEIARLIDVHAAYLANQSTLGDVDAAVQAVERMMLPEDARTVITPPIRDYFEAHWYGTADGNPAVQHLVDVQTDDMVDIVLTALGVSQPTADPTATDGAVTKPGDSTR